MKNIKNVTKNSTNVSVATTMEMRQSILQKKYLSKKGEDSHVDKAFKTI